MSHKDESNNSNLSFITVIGSVLASFFGVQNSENRKRDFERGKATQFIVAGLLMTAVWYGLIAMIVSVVLSQT